MSEMQINASGQMALEDGGYANSFRSLFTTNLAHNQPNKSTCSCQRHFFNGVERDQKLPSCDRLNRIIVRSMDSKLNIYRDNKSKNLFWKII